MKPCHALGFFTLGVAMSLLPQVAPSWFAPGIVGTASARDLWIALMSWVQMAIGVGGLTRRALSLLSEFLRYEPGKTATPIRASAAVPALRQVAPAQPVPYPIGFGIQREAA